MMPRPQGWCDHTAVSDYRETLRALAVQDGHHIDLALSDDVQNLAVSGLDAKTHALVQLGALIALDAAPPSYAAAAEAAQAAGATRDEIVGTLIATMPVAGVARVTSAAPQLGLGLGYDVDAGLEQLDEAALHPSA